MQNQGLEEVFFFFFFPNLPTKNYVLFIYLIKTNVAGSHNIDPTNARSNPNTSKVRGARIHRREQPAHQAREVSS